MDRDCDKEGHEPVRSLSHLLGQVRAEVLAVLDRELCADPHLGPYRVTAAQFRVMTRLEAAAQKQPMAELCRRMAYDPGGMTRMLDRLESKGLIRRTRCPGDRRQIYLELTDLGRTTYPKMREISRAVQNRFLRGFSQTDVRQLERLLGRMLENTLR